MQYGVAEAEFAADGDRHDIAGVRSRTGADCGSDRAADRPVQPGLAMVASLVAGATANGLQVCPQEVGPFPDALKHLQGHMRIEGIRRAELAGEPGGRLLDLCLSGKPLGQVPVLKSRSDVLLQHHLREVRNLEPASGGLGGEGAQDAFMQSDRDLGHAVRGHHAFSSTLKLRQNSVFGGTSSSRMALAPSDPHTSRAISGFRISLPAWPRSNPVSQPAAVR
ncbi:MAG: hypothetical protein ACJ8AI_11060 [Rhodopila sp.]